MDCYYWVKFGDCRKGRDCTFKHAGRHRGYDADLDFFEYIGAPKPKGKGKGKRKGKGKGKDEEQIEQYDPEDYEMQEDEPSW